MFWCCDLSWEWVSMCKCRVAQHTEKKSNRVAFFLTQNFRPNCMNAYLLKFPVKKKDSARISRKKKARKFIRFLLNPHMFLVHTLCVCKCLHHTARCVREKIREKGKNLPLLLSYTNKQRSEGKNQRKWHYQEKEREGFDADVCVWIGLSESRRIQEDHIASSNKTHADDDDGTTAKVKGKSSKKKAFFLNTIIPPPLPAYPSSFLGKIRIKSSYHHSNTVLIFPTLIHFITLNSHHHRSSCPIHLSQYIALWYPST